jgi:flagellar hook-associated protein 2
MAEGVLGLGSSGSNGLSQELIDKLKSAESKARIDPYTKKLETWDKELEKITEIEAKVAELEDKISGFNLFASGANAFEQVTASTTGTSALFNAVDISGLQEGSSTVTISQLAQKDVHQTVTFSNKDAQIDGGNDENDSISIQIGTGTTYDFSTVDKTYTELAEEINKNSSLIASVEQVDDDNYRLVIKSKDTGLSNSLTINQTGLDLGFSNILVAQNMNAQIDGVDYDISSNTVTIQGNLTMTAVEIGTSTISVQQDNGNILPKLNEFVTSYNDLVKLIDEELYSADSAIEDMSSLKMVVSGIKDKLFGSYGDADDKNLFNYGLGLDKSGMISIDTKVFGKALTDNLEDIKELFIGTAEKEGLGTQLNTYLDNLDGYDGLLTRYGESMGNRKTTLEKEKKSAQEALDSKYSFMSLQFASYTALITQMENAFGGMKRMMQTETSK